MKYLEIAGAVYFIDDMHDGKLPNQLLKHFRHMMHCNKSFHKYNVAVFRAV